MRIVMDFILYALVVMGPNAVGSGILSIRIVPSSPTVLSGTAIMLQVTITNNSQDVAAYHDYNRDCDYTIRVTVNGGSPATESAYKRELPCDKGLRNVTIRLKPGESKEDRITISRLYDMSSPGEYSVQISRAFPGIGEVKSNVVTVTIAPQN